MCIRDRNWMIPHAHVDINIASLVGSASVMAGLTRMTVTIVVLVIEITNEFKYIIPISLAVMCSTWFADRFSESIIEVLIEVKEAPYLHWEPPHEFDKLRANDVMQSQFVTLYEKDYKRVIKKKVFGCTHNGFPVINKEKGTLRGIISRKEVLKCLEEAAGKSDLDKIDLRKRLNRWPYTLGPNSSLSHVFFVFRLMGLRHLLIVNVQSKVVGIIGRNELTHNILHTVHNRVEKERAADDLENGGQYGFFSSHGKKFWNYGQSAREWSVYNDGESGVVGSLSSDSDSDSDSDDASYDDGEDSDSSSNAGDSLGTSEDLPSAKGTIN
eukprot:TRINITY_DN5443_c0_g2_i1.p1 TRINITY_DN5443_c0_g2~~TRINITY_DN5443_c0_g2_i1.p1  ORF type:complete len:326 (+),score=53.24 TRINITY_DN5443_c0_g2_i1:46-1023(+)